MLVKDLEEDITLNIVNVYGAPHAKDMQDFLVELVHMLGCNRFPFSDWW